MIVGVCEATFRAEWVTSLKEKRMAVKGLIEKTRHKFNVSVAEVDRQEEHKLFVVGFACVTNETRHADAMLRNILDFMEKNTEAELISAEREIW